MPFDWQDALALSIVAVAAAYVGRQAWLVMRRRRAARCGSCAQCPATPSALVSLDLGVPPSRAERPADERFGVR